MRLLSREFLPTLAIVLATFFWGSSFFTIGKTLEATNPFELVFWRFTIGAILIAPLLGRRITRIPRHTWRAGVFCGLALTAGYLTSAIGLVSIPSSTSGFLTALYVPFTPLLMWFVYSKRPSAAAFLAVGIAFLGLILLANPFGMTFENNAGELFTIASAFLSAVEIIIAGRFAPHCNARELAFTQLVMTGAYMAVATLVAHLFIPDLRPTQYNETFFVGVGWLAVIVGAAQVLLAWGQKTVPPDRAAIIYSLESVFAAVIGYIAGERLGVGGVTGGALIVLAVFVSEMKGVDAFLNRLINRLFTRKK